MTTTKTKSVSERLQEGVASRGLRQKLLSSSPRDQRDSAQFVSQILRCRPDSSELLPKLLTARIVAAAMDSTEL